MGSSPISRSYKSYIYIMFYKKRIYFVKSIIILNNVYWCGKLPSYFSIYEMVFRKFIINFLKEKSDVKLLIKQKESSYITKVRLENYKPSRQIEILDLNKYIFIKVYLDISIISVYKLNLNFVYLDKNLLFNFLFIHDNIICLVYNDNLYIMNNINININEWKNDNFSKLLTNNLNENKFYENINVVSVLN